MSHTHTINTMSEPKSYQLSVSPGGGLDPAVLLEGLRKHAYANLVSLEGTEGVLTVLVLPSEESKNTDSQPHFRERVVLKLVGKQVGNARALEVLKSQIVVATENDPLGALGQMISQGEPDFLVPLKASTLVEVIRRSEQKVNQQKRKREEDDNPNPHKKPKLPKGIRKDNWRSVMGPSGPFSEAGPRFSDRWHAAWQHYDDFSFATRAMSQTLMQAGGDKGAVPLSQFRAWALELNLDPQRPRAGPELEALRKAVARGDFSTIAELRAAVEGHCDSDKNVIAAGIGSAIGNGLEGRVARYRAGKRVLAVAGGIGKKMVISAGASLGLSGMACYRASQYARIIDEHPQAILLKGVNVSTYSTQMTEVKGVLQDLSDGVTMQARNVLA